MDKYLPRLAALIILAVLLVAGWSWLGPGFSPAGSVIDPPQPAPEIALADTAGTAFRLSSLRGKIVLLFFGYTFCPDVCPGTLKDMQDVFENLGEAAEEVRFVFITVDPDRDDPARLRSYLDRFDPRFIGLTGSGAELAEVYEDYSVNVVRSPGAGAAGYDFEHAPRIYVIDRAGQLVETFPYGLGWEAMLSDIQHLVSQKDS